ncbi:formyl transferase [Nemania serpens]|nr:formyl transferase [Nemania serpens]
MSHLFGSSRATVESAILLFSSRLSNHLIVRNRVSYFLHRGYHRAPKIQQRLVATSHSHRGRRYSTTPEKISDPLHILFCGSDDFSCASLKALHDEHVGNPDLVRSIDVVVRPGKPTGRGYKVIRDPPLRSLANSLGLQIHERDTFTGWDMPTKTNLIIAVSFGLFVPPRLLSAAKYGGLNMHPSLLPDLRGPAPLQHALLAGRAVTGVSLQTLDPKAFDHGVVLAQTPSDPSDPSALRIPPSCATVAQLQSLVTPVATRMLIDALRAGLHVPPLRERGWTTTTPPTTASESLALLHAPKITKRDRLLTAAILRACDGETSDPNRGTRGVLARRQAAIGPLWFVSRDRQGRRKRVIIDALEEVPGLSPASRPGMIKAAAAVRTETHSPPHAHTQTQYLIPFEEDPEETEGTQQEQQVEPALNLVFWDTADANQNQNQNEHKNEDENEDENEDKNESRKDALYLGNYRILSLKVEGEKAKPARLALQRFFIS